MVITYKNNAVKFCYRKAKLPVLIKNQQFMVTWGRRENEEGSLPTMPYLAEEVIKAGLFDGFKQQLVPILADSYDIKYQRDELFPRSVPPNCYIQGILIELNGEKRVYVVCTLSSSVRSVLPSPKIMYKS